MHQGKRKVPSVLGLWHQPTKVSLKFWKGKLLLFLHSSREHIQLKESISRTKNRKKGLTCRILQEQNGTSNSLTYTRDSYLAGWLWRRRRGKQDTLQNKTTNLKLNGRGRKYPHPGSLQTVHFSGYCTSLGVSLLSFREAHSLQRNLHVFQMYHPHLNVIILLQQVMQGGEGGPPFSP